MFSLRAAGLVAAAAAALLACAVVLEYACPADGLGVLADMYVLWAALPFACAAHWSYLRSTAYVFDHFWASCILVGGGAACGLLLGAAWWAHRRMAAPKKTRPIK